MSEIEEKCEKEAEEAFSDLFPLYKLITSDMWKRSKESGWGHFLIGYLKGCQKRQEEIRSIKPCPTCGKEICSNFSKDYWRIPDYCPDCGRRSK